MTSYPVRRSSASPRTRGLALTGCALALLSAFCLQLLTSNMGAWRAVLEPGPASLDQALAALCGSLAMALATWLLCALALSLLAAVGSGSSRLGAAVAHAACLVAPTLLRNAIAALLGVTIVAGPAAADSTSAAALSGAVAGSQAAAAQAWPAAALAVDQALSPAWTPSSAWTPSATPRSDLVPGWVPARPASGRSATPPAPTPSLAATPWSGPGATATPRATATSLTAAASRAAAATSQAAAASQTAAASRAAAAAARTAGAGSGSAPGLAPPRRAGVDPDGELVVRRGDTLWSLARRHLGPGATDGEVAVEWPHWFTANRSVIGNDPDQLVPGERLRPPERGQGAVGTSTVRPEHQVRGAR